jgi:hypothetical protein
VEICSYVLPAERSLLSKNFELIVLVAGSSEDDYIWRVRTNLIPPTLLPLSRSRLVTTISELLILASHPHLTVGKMVPSKVRFRFPSPMRRLFSGKHKDGSQSSIRVSFIHWSFSFTWGLLPPFIGHCT